MKYKHAWDTSRVKLDGSFVARNVNSLMEIIDERVQLFERNALWPLTNQPSGVHVSCISVRFVSSAPSGNSATEAPDFVMRTLYYSHIVIVTQDTCVFKIFSLFLSRNLRILFIRIIIISSIILNVWKCYLAILFSNKNAFSFPTLIKLKRLFKLAIRVNNIPLFDLVLISFVRKHSLCSFVYPQKNYLSLGREICLQKCNLRDYVTRHKHILR